MRQFFNLKILCRDIATKDSTSWLLLTTHRRRFIHCRNKLKSDYYGYRKTDEQPGSSCRY